MDGNFKAEHMKNRRSHDDVALSDGQGYMPARSPYMEYLNTVTETKQVGGSPSTHFPRR